MDEEDRAEEDLQHQVNLDAFKIGKYPVIFDPSEVEF